MLSKDDEASIPSTVGLNKRDFILCVCELIVTVASLSPLLVTGLSQNAEGGRAGGRVGGRVHILIEQSPDPVASMFVWKGENAKSITLLL